ncbi:hypothetical protein PCH_Pc16g08990 [Penicillium rubens Wisconsin 54-1255]|uniref:Uncharacterized protein n=1 Tax=Penicillium rubens (strain ATCC 28089 / DSM 1075 / NRRL 1951 / Wisconsin 54-1255) TaxID=500485 RepID=B6H840_PENRW|nr:hypothetical protein PCH_Pc16g08990 [Penicillium rubens Wisconsin 54-1255]
MNHLRADDFGGSKMRDETGKGARRLKGKADLQVCAMDSRRCAIPPRISNTQDQIRTIHEPGAIGNTSSPRAFPTPKNVGGNHCNDHHSLTELYDIQVAQAALAKGSSMWSRTDDKMGKEEEHEYMQIQIIKRRI